VERVNWFSTYRVHHRVAGKFRQGRAFLLGDAGHIHSPVGGQGMNTGIGDAVNLSWKLAAVLDGRANARLLDTYEPERIAFARRLVSTTDTVFSFVTSSTPIARWVRLSVVPRILPPLAALDWARRFLFRTVSQIALQYRASRLSAGAAGGVHGGDRLPWVPPDTGAVNGATTGDNYTPLTSLDWQMHVYGDLPPGVGAICSARGLALHVFPWRPAMQAAGIDPGTCLLVRPDGYVAVAGDGASPEKLERYLNEWELRSRVKG